jgi:hypothetical protein
MGLQIQDSRSEGSSCNERDAAASPAETEEGEGVAELGAGREIAVQGGALIGRGDVDRPSGWFFGSMEVPQRVPRWGLASSLLDCLGRRLCPSQECAAGVPSSKGRSMATRDAVRSREVSG